MDREQFFEYLTAFLRTLVLPLSSLLASTGFFTKDQAATVILTAIPLLVSLVWSWANKRGWGKKVDTALKLPAGSTKETLKAVNKL